MQAWEILPRFQMATSPVVPGYQIASGEPSWNAASQATPRAKGESGPGPAWSSPSRRPGRAWQRGNQHGKGGIPTQQHPLELIGNLPGTQLVEESGTLAVIGDESSENAAVDRPAGRSPLGKRGGEGLSERLSVLTKIHLQGGRTAFPAL